MQREATGGGIGGRFGVDGLIVRLGVEIMCNSRGRISVVGQFERQCSLGG
jgi:hypothetical protein